MICMITLKEYSQCFKVFLNWVIALSTVEYSQLISAVMPAAYIFIERVSKPPDVFLINCNTDLTWFFSFKVSCSPQGLHVWVKDTMYLCSRSGQVLTVRIQMNGWIHVGNLLCPACSDFCDSCPPEQDPPASNLTRAAPIGRLPYLLKWNFNIKASEEN